MCFELVPKKYEIEIFIVDESNGATKEAKIKAAEKFLWEKSFWLETNVSKYGFLF